PHRPTLCLCRPCSSPTGLSTRSLPDALPISRRIQSVACATWCCTGPWIASRRTYEVVVSDSYERISMVNFEAPRLVASKFTIDIDRKSTRLNSSHVKISYAVFCLQKKKYSPE